MGAYALGLGIGTQDRDGQWLEVFTRSPCCTRAALATSFASGTGRLTRTRSSDWRGRLSDGRRRGVAAPRAERAAAHSDAPPSPSACGGFGAGFRARGLPQAAPAVAPPGAAAGDQDLTGCSASCPTWPGPARAPSRSTNWPSASSMRACAARCWKSAASTSFRR
jgi:hypothetical protein